jgi:hypothetical protein
MYPNVHTRWTQQHPFQQFPLSQAVDRDVLRTKEQLGVAKITNPVTTTVLYKTGKKC